jgi:hypothetical protein
MLMKNLFFKTLSFIFTYGYFVLGIAQVHAITSGLQTWMEVDSSLMVLPAIALVLVPYVGPGLAMLGAIEGWGWSPLFAMFLFGLPYLIYVFMLLGVAGHVKSVERRVKIRKAA